jgi:hypothetical protein
MTKKAKGQNGLRFTPPLLGAKSVRNFRKFYKACARDLKPSGPVQQMYVQEFALSNAQIADLREVKHGTLMRARQSALLQILQQLIDTYSDVVPDLDDAPELLAARYFKEEKIREQVLGILASFGIPEAAIEAQALKEEMPFLDRIERQLASFAAGRDNALACFAACRESFPDRLDRPATPMLESKEPRPVEINKEEPKAEEEE